jgi:biopolymer transport protein ExbB/TolQ
MTDQIVAFALLGADWVLYLLAALSVLSIAVVVERAMFFHRRKVDHQALQKETIRAIQDDSVNALRNRYKGHEAMAARVALAGVDNRSHGIEAASEAMNSAKLASKEEYEQLTVILGTLGNNAPFIGLFGTVLGIIKAFNDLQADPTGGINAVMGSTSEALVATAVGILVAIPAVVAFNVFNRLMRSHLAHSDALAHAILSAMHTSLHDEEEQDEDEESD